MPFHLLILTQKSQVGCRGRAATLMSTVMVLLWEWSEFSRLFFAFRWLLSAYGHWYRERVEVERAKPWTPLYRVRPCPRCTWESTYLLFFFVPYLRIFSLSLLYPFICSDFPCNVMHTAMCFGFKWVLRSLATVWSALTAPSSPFEPCSFSLIPEFYCCTRQHPLILS